MDKIIVKYANKNINKELNSINFDKSYINCAVSKYQGFAYKIFNLKPYEANILKQICLSLGFDCAVSRDTVTCKCEFTDCIVFASDNQMQKLILKLKEQPFRLKQLSEELDAVINPKLESLTIRNTIFVWSHPYIMGILNVTPDSFSDGGKYSDISSALSHCRQMIDDGADIIDIGGESTRPGAEILSVDEEIKRVIPVIKELRKEGITIPISIDTRNYETAKAAIESGADIINDVSGFDYDENLYNFVCENNIPSVIMHSDKVPAVSNDFTKGDVVEDVYFSLKEKIDKLQNSGLQPKNIIADIGIGFGKSLESNYELLRRADEFKSLNVPMLLGISRKSFIRNMYKINYEQADVVTALYSSHLKSINIHRVHNVALTKKFLDFTNELI